MSKFSADQQCLSIDEQIERVHVILTFTFDNWEELRQYTGGKLQKFQKTVNEKLLEFEQRGMDINEYRTKYPRIVTPRKAVLRN